MSIEEICKQDNQLLTDYNNGLITKSQYDYQKKELHQRYAIEYISERSYLNKLIRKKNGDKI